MDSMKPPLPDENELSIATVQPSARVQDDRAHLLALPNEILTMICRELVNQHLTWPTLDLAWINWEWELLSKLSMTCKRLRDITLPILYREVRLSCSIHNHICYQALAVLRSLVENSDLRPLVHSVDLMQIRSIDRGPISDISTLLPNDDDLGPRDRWFFTNNGRAFFRQLLREFLPFMEVNSGTGWSNQQLIDHSYLSADIQAALVLGVLSESIRSAHIPRLVDMNINFDLNSTITFPQLRVLGLEISNWVSDFGLYIMRNSPILHTLRLFDSTGEGKRRQADPPSSQLPDLPRLRTLSLFNFQSLNKFKAIINSYSHISHFKVSSPTVHRQPPRARDAIIQSNKAFWALESLVCASSTLETLIIGPCPKELGARDTRHLTSFENFPHLKTLGIWSGNILWDRDSILVDFVDGCTELETVMLFRAEFGVNYERDPRYFRRALCELANAAINGRFPRLKKITLSFSDYPLSWDNPDSNDADDNENDDGDNDEDGDPNILPIYRDEVIGPEKVRFYARLFRSAGLAFSVLAERVDFLDGCAMFQWEQPDCAFSFFDEVPFSLE